jgi:phenylacetate-CoA ligase
LFVSPTGQAAYPITEPAERLAHSQKLSYVAYQDSLRIARLRRTLAATAVAHPFYRARFKEIGLKSGDIRTLDELERLPLTRKDDYIANPDAFRLEPNTLPDDFSKEERVLWDLTYTTGTTTGRPSPFYNTTHDAYAVWDQACRCSEAEGLCSSDRIANLYPVANFPTGAFLSVARTGMILGLPVVHALTGSANSEFKVRNSLPEALTKVLALRPSVLWGVPSFIRRFLHEAHTRAARFPELRLIITSGEPVSDRLREEFHDLAAGLGTASISVLARYAFTEMQGGLVQCAESAAPQNVCPDLYYLEVVEPDTGRRLPEGEPGMLAITHLHRRGTVLLRYLVGDIVTLSNAPCPVCNRRGERVVTTPRRTGRLIKCRGMLVNTKIIEDVLSHTEGIGEFQIVFARDDSPKAMDRLVIRVEPRGHGGNELRSAVIRRVHDAVSLLAEVEFVARSGIYDHERGIKLKRVVDLRSPAD